MPKNNMFKIGVATAAAAVGAILAITSVFAHVAPSTSGRSVVGTLANAAHAASFPLLANEAAPNTLSDEQAQDEEEAAELAAKIAAEQQELAAKLAAKQAEQAAEAAAEAAEAAEADEDADENEAADNNHETEQKTEHHDSD